MTQSKPIDFSRLTVAELVLEAAHVHANKPALLTRDRQWSYAELLDRSNRVAATLQERGVGPGDIVALLVRRGPEAIAAIIGVLRSGAAYLPLDPAAPNKLQEAILADCQAAALLIDRGLLEQAPSWEGSSLDLKGVLDSPVRSVSLPRISGEDPAYVMYTSGSTGEPKGVVVPHRGVVRLVMDTDYVNFDCRQVFLQLAPLSFDASTFEIWGALLHGGRLVFADTEPAALDDIADAITRFGVTAMFLTTGLFHVLAEQRPAALKPLRQLLIGGDVLSPDHLARVREILADCRLVNAYGPTENTTFTTSYLIPQTLLPGPLPIGTAISHSSIYVLDDVGQPVSDGETGELYAGGSGVALGYLNRPQLNAERFLPDPFSDQPGALMYRTGDRGLRRPDGMLEFLGRADRQVKIDGKRVELDDLEALLRRSGMTADAAVIAPRDAAGRRRIEAYVTALNGSGVAMDALRGFMASEVPPYMLPSLIVEMDALPLTTTGKVDRSRLQAPEQEAAPLVLASNELEALLCELWHQVLGHAGFALEDNFFDCGGSSLQLIQVHDQLCSRLGRSIVLLELFRHPSIRSLANYLSEDAADCSDQIRSRGARREAVLLGLARQRARGNGQMIDGVT